MANRDQLIIKHRNKPGLKGKIFAKCIECIYDPFQSGSWRQQVQDCTSKNCPLFSVRPYTSIDQLGAKTENVCNDLPEIITA